MSMIYKPKKDEKLSVSPTVHHSSFIIDSYAGNGRQSEKEIKLSNRNLATTLIRWMM